MNETAFPAVPLALTGGNTAGGSVGRHTYGRHTYGPINVMEWPTGDGSGNCKVTIGSFVSISFGGFILAGGEHRTDWVSTYPFPAAGDIWGAKQIAGHPAHNGNIVIGNDVWLGACVIVLSGAEIGDGAVIGAGSVVAGKVPPYSICTGHPLRRISSRFEPAIVERLLRIRWWDWPDEKIARAVPFMMASNVAQFCQLAQEGRFG